MITYKYNNKANQRTRFYPVRRVVYMDADQDRIIENANDIYRLHDPFLPEGYFLLNQETKCIPGTKAKIDLDLFYEYERAEKLKREMVENNLEILIYDFRNYEPAKSSKEKYSKYYHRHRHDLLFLNHNIAKVEVEIAVLGGNMNNYWEVIDETFNKMRPDSFEQYQHDHWIWSQKIHFHIYRDADGQINFM